MSDRARLMVMTGPDRGKFLDIVEDLVHVGREIGCQIVLTDPDVQDHQLSICRRNGRYAVYAPGDATIQVDGNMIPAEQWVWLPEEAEIQISPRTSARFMAEEAADPSGAADSRAARAATGVKEKPKAAAKPRSTSNETDSLADLPKVKKGARRADKKPKDVARFITDGPGDPLVKLGDDGHLPELKLEDAGKTRTENPSGPKAASPLGMIAVLVFSLSASLLMLFLDFEITGSAALSKAAARAEIGKYYGEEGEVLRPYQIWLREAQQAFSRGDYRGEKQEYRKVLDLLRAEGNDRTYSGVTGNKNDRSDARLEELISILLQQ